MSNFWGKTPQRTPEEIILDSDIVNIHGSAKFCLSPREVVDQGILKCALGYHQGSTAKNILRAHGLTTSTDSDSYHLTPPKGRDYFKAVWKVDKRQPTVD